HADAENPGEIPHRGLLDRMSGEVAGEAIGIVGTEKQTCRRIKIVRGGSEGKSAARGAHSAALCSDHEEERGSAQEGAKTVGRSARISQCAYNRSSTTNNTGDPACRCVRTSAAKPRCLRWPSRCSPVAPRH